jgi:hypothetical protein
MLLPSHLRSEALSPGNGGLRRPLEMFGPYNDGVAINSLLQSGATAPRAP